MSDEFQCGVVVLGGGVAGVSAALELRRGGVSAWVLERTGYSQWRPGETLSPVARAELQRLGLVGQPGEEDILVSEGIESAWGEEEPRFHSFLTNPYGQGWHMDRQCFDARLSLRAREHQVRVLTRASVVGLERTPAGWHVQARTPSGPLDLFCEAVVDATGRAAQVARQCGVRRCMEDALCSVSALVEMTEERERTLLVETTPLGWWYVAPQPGGRALVSLLSDADLLSRHGAFQPSGWSRLLADTRYIRERLGWLPGVTRLHVRPCETSRLERFSGEGWVAVGDAASMFDPLSSGGILKALRSGRGAAAALRATLGGDRGALHRYEEEQATAFSRYLGARQAHYALEQRWAGETFWQRRRAVAAQEA
jgi:flavin-dependent dehydrogenase